MSRTDLPAISQTVKRALEATGCVGVADMAVELVRVRAERDALREELAQWKLNHTAAINCANRLESERDALQWKHEEAIQHRQTHLELAEARAEIARLTDSIANTEWQPIETAKLDTALLLWCGWRFDVGHWNSGLGKWVENWEHRGIHPTHWMPLPAPPAETKEPR